MTIEQNAQNGWNDKFEQWDYQQADINELKYGQPTPPLFPLQRITVPTAVIYSSTTEVEDIEKFLLDPVMSRFNSVKYRQKLDIAEYPDFYMGKDMSWFLPEVLPFLNRYSGRNNN